MKRGILVGVALACGMAVACSDPRAGTLPTPSVTGSTEPTATPSREPSADPHGDVRSAVRRYFDALNLSLREPSSAPHTLGPLISQQCSCRQILDVLARLAEKGHYLDYTYAVSQIRIQQLGDIGASMTYVVTQTAGHERRADGGVVSSFAATKARYSVHFRREGSHWLLNRSDVMK